MADISNDINMGFRVDRDLKVHADELFKKNGYETSFAFNMFLTKSISKPFISSLEIPSARLISAMEEVLAIESGKIKAKKYKTFEEALEDID